MSAMSDDRSRKFGLCKMCGRDNLYLYLCLASYKGNPVCVWLCDDCYKELKEKEKKKYEGEQRFLNTVEQDNG